MAQELVGCNCDEGLQGSIACTFNNITESGEPYVHFPLCLHDHDVETLSAYQVRKECAVENLDRNGSCTLRESVGELSSMIKDLTELFRRNCLDCDNDLSIKSASITYRVITSVIAGIADSGYPMSVFRFQVGLFPEGSINYTPEWHVDIGDGLIPTSYLVGFVLKGQNTILCDLQEQMRVKFIGEFLNYHNDPMLILPEEKLASQCFGKQESADFGHGSIITIGSNKSAVHRSPPMNRDGRIYISLVLADKRYLVL